MNRFTQAEIALIHRAYRINRNPSFIQKMVSNRSLHAIKAQVAKMFPRQVKTGDWTCAEMENLADFIAGGKNMSYLAKYLNRAAPDIEAKAKDLDLRIGQQIADATIKKNEKRLVERLKGKKMTVALIAKEQKECGPVSPWGSPLERAAACIAHWHDLAQDHVYGCGEANIPPDGLAPRVVNTSKEVLSYCSSSADW